MADKQNLWRLLDERVAEGMDLPYDCMERGCAISCFRLIKEALAKDENLTITQWPSLFSMTRRELVSRQLEDYPWTAFILYALVGVDGDIDVENEDKIVTPSDLLFVLSHSKLNGKPLLENEGEELVPWGDNDNGHLFPSPLLISFVLLFGGGGVFTNTCCCLYKRA